MLRYLCIIRENDTIRWFIGDEEDQNHDGDNLKVSDLYKQLNEDLQKVNCISGFNLGATLNWLDHHIDQYGDESYKTNLKAQLRNREKVYLSL